MMSTCHTLTACSMAWNPPVSALFRNDIITEESTYSLRNSGLHADVILVCDLDNVKIRIWSIAEYHIGYKCSMAMCIGYVLAGFVITIAQSPEFIVSFNQRMTSLHACV